MVSARTVEIFDAIEEQLGGKPLLHRKKRNLTPFNAARREQKIANIEAHLARHPRDRQSDTHRTAMIVRLKSGGKSVSKVA